MCPISTNAADVCQAKSSSNCATAVQVVIGDLNPSNYIEYDILNIPSGKLT